MEEQLSVNHCNLVSLAIFNIFIHLFLALLRFNNTTFELIPLLTFLFSFFPKLDSPAIPVWADETPVKVTEPLHDIQDLTTIDFSTLDDLHEDNEATPKGASSKRFSEVGEDLINQCVTPTRVKSIKTALSRPESERHLCAFKLLPHFFSKQELAESNTDGSYEKQCLDSIRLNSLKVLVFSKFPLGANEDKERARKFVKGKIKSKCRTNRKQLLSASTQKRSP